MKHMDRLRNLLSDRALYLGIALSGSVLSGCMDSGTTSGDAVTLQQRVTLYDQPESPSKPIAELAKGDVIHPDCRRRNPEDPESPFVLVRAILERGQETAEGFVIEAFVPNMKRDLPDCA